MNASKITHVHVWIIGGVLMLLTAVGLFFVMLKPLNEQNVAKDSTVQNLLNTQVQVDGQNFGVEQIKDAEKALALARARRNASEAELKAIERRKQLPANQEIRLGTTQDDLVRTALPRWLTLPRTVVTRIEAYAQKSAKKHGVKVFTNFQAPAPSTNPATIPTDVIAWGLGGMSVTGPFPNVMAWVEDWNNAPLLSSVEGLKLTLAGRGGEVSAGCGLVVYIFPTGPGAKIAPAAGGGAPADGMAPGGGNMADMGGDMGGPPSDMPGGTSAGANGP